MSSHREAPEISKDPVADSTDLYAFVSPDEPDTVTLIANYIPFEAPDGGPNFYEFGQDVTYEINVDNDGDGQADVIFQFNFDTDVTDPTTFLYNTGPILSLTDSHWVRRQSYSVTRLDVGDWGVRSTVLGTNLPCPPCNIGPLSTPNYVALAEAAVRQVGEDVRVFAGQRAEGFYVDLGSIFDLAVLRPFEQDHTTFGLQNTGLGKMAAGVNSTKAANVHTIALQVPKCRADGEWPRPQSMSSPGSVIGVWTTASRQKVRVPRRRLQPERLCRPVGAGVTPRQPARQRGAHPHGAQGLLERPAACVGQPVRVALLQPAARAVAPGAVPGRLPEPRRLQRGAPNRADLVAILLTGIPAGLITGFQNFTGTTQADMLRLNMAIPPASSPKNTGLLGADIAGFPNGRRVFDDVVTIELRAVAGAVLKLVDSAFTPDAAAGAINQGLTSGDSDPDALNTESYLPAFPYLGVPHSGFTTPAS